MSRLKAVKPTKVEELKCVACDEPADGRCRLCGRPFCSYCRLFAPHDDPRCDLGDDEIR